MVSPRCMVQQALASLVARCGGSRRGGCRGGQPRETNPAVNTRASERAWKLTTFCTTNCLAVVGTPWGVPIPRSLLDSPRLASWPRRLGCASTAPAELEERRRHLLLPHVFRVRAGGEPAPGGEAGRRLARRRHRPTHRPRRRLRHRLRRPCHSWCRPRFRSWHRPRRRLRRPHGRLRRPRRRWHRPRRKRCCPRCRRHYPRRSRHRPRHRRCRPPRPRWHRQRLAHVRRACGPGNGRCEVRRSRGGPCGRRPGHACRHRRPCGSTRC